MKSLSSVSILMAFICMTVTASFTVMADDQNETPQNDKIVLETEKDRFSYIIGVQVGGSIMQGGLDLNPDMLARGIKDIVEDNELAMSEEEMQEAMMALQKKMSEAQEEMQREMQDRQREEGGKNLAAAQAFLEKNATEEGVIVRDSGLQYRVLTEGSGDMPTADSQVRVHYKGTLLDGTQFDSSYDRGEPAQFRAGQVIQGWQEALQLMAVGSKWQLFIPPGLAYGESGRPGIPPNAMLIFEVELLEIVE